MAHMACIETKNFLAFIADNWQVGIHKSGQNGVASLVSRRTGNNVFVPSLGGMDYEIIALKGLPPYPTTGYSPFEPRNEPMEIADAHDGSVTLIQPKTSHSHISARITFTVEEPYYLHQHIELTFHKRFCGKKERNEFHSLWASYIHTPADRHIYVKRDMKSGPLYDWVGLTKKDHGPANWFLTPLPDYRELTAGEHLSVMENTEPLELDYGPVPPTDPLTLGDEPLPGPLYFYYGLVNDDDMMLFMFRQPEQFRFAYSPCGGGKEPAWSPAWDYVLKLEDAKLETPYAWDVCLAYKPYQGREDVLKEVKRYVKGVLP